MQKLVVTRFGRTALAAGILSIGMLSWGIAQAATGANTGGSKVTNVPATVAGMPPTAQTFYAVVNADGTKARSFPLTTTTSHVGTGNYVVTTKQNVTGCAYVASTGQTGTTSVAPGSANAQGASGNPNGVFVQTLNPAGTVADEPFHLAIFC